MEYLDGELSQEQRSAFESHLKACSDCVAFIESYKQTLRLAKQLQIPETDPEVDKISENNVLEDVPHGLVDAILAARPK